MVCTRGVAIIASSFVAGGMPANLFARLRTLGDLAPDDEEEDVPNCDLAGSKVMAGECSHFRFCSVAVHSEDFRSKQVATVQ